MAAFSTLRGKAAQEQLARISKIYANNRPLIQRVLNIGLVLYAIGSTYYGLSGAGRGGSSRKGKGKAKSDEKPDDGKPERVAVSVLPHSASSEYLMSPTPPSGRCRFLSAPIPDLKDRCSWNSLQRSSPATHALEPSGIQNCDISVCRGS